jgi:hypothetical protein
MTDTKPLKIKLSEKEYYQLEGDLYIWEEGDGMCQQQAINIMAITWEGPVKIRFGRKDLAKILAKLKGRLPQMNETNFMEFNKEISKIEEGDKDD